MVRRDLKVLRKYRRKEIEKKVFIGLLATTLVAVAITVVKK